MIPATVSANSNESGRKTTQTKNLQGKKPMKLNKLIAAAGMALVSTTSMAVPSVQFLVDGNTFTQRFGITNRSSSAADKIIGVEIHLQTGFVFNTQDVVDADGKVINQGAKFTWGSDNAATPLLDEAASATLPANNGTSMKLAFDNSFGGVEACGSAFCDFWWTVDVDSSASLGAGSGLDPTVYGNDLIGSTISVTFSNGGTLSGTFGELAGRSQAAYWSATGNGTVTPPPPNGTPEPGSLALAGLALLGLGAARRAKRA